MTLQEVLERADAISLGRLVYMSVNGEEALPVRSVVLDMEEDTLIHRIVLTNMEGAKDIYGKEDDQRSARGPNGGAEGHSEGRVRRVQEHQGDRMT